MLGITMQLDISVRLILSNVSVFHIMEILYGKDFFALHIKVKTYT